MSKSQSPDRGSPGVTTGVELRTGSNKSSARNDSPASAGPAKKRAAHARVPSDAPRDMHALEDKLLHRVDIFLYKLEERLDEFEAFGHQKLVQLDESVATAYAALSAIRNDVLGSGRKRAETFVEEGRKRADLLVRAIEKEYRDLLDSDDTLPNRALAGLRHLEEKLSHIENRYSELIDGSLAAAVQEALSAAAHRLLTYDELPTPWRENPYIINGYRFCRGYGECLMSIVRVHNETCNIWTHLAGFFVMLGLAFYHLPNTISWTNATWADRLWMTVFLVAAMKCLVCSAAWHTFSSISRLQAKQNMACVDYSGITVLIAASILTTEYAALYCDTTARNFYMALTAFSGLGGLAFTWTPSFDEPEGRVKRVAFFVAFAVAGFLGFFHAAFLHGFLPTLAFYAPVFKSLFCYSLGVVIYSFLIPERWMPGSIFDYFGMSHNLWHICVFGGIYYHYVATVHLLEGARHFSCAAHHAL